MKYFRILHDMRLSFYICTLFGILLLGFQVVIYFSLFRSVMLKHFRVLHDMRLSYVINAYFFGKLLLGFKVVIYLPLIYLVQRQITCLKLNSCIYMVSLLRQFKNCFFVL